MLENFLAGLMRQAGVEPENIRQAYLFVSGLEAELRAFKAGVPNVVAHFNTRLDALERKVDHLITALSALPGDPLRPGVPPGVTIAAPDYAPVVTIQPPLNGGTPHE
jgi:hypothetical protein